MKTKRNKTTLGIAAIVVIISFAACFAAYVGHENDRDIAAFLKTYPAAKGNALDSCALCHRDGDVPDSGIPGKTKYVNACDYCHIVSWQGKKPYKESLNAFGRDYLVAGRNAAAFKKIESKDSDGDKFKNIDEIRKSTSPGDAGSNPNLKTAPGVVLTFDKLTKIAPVVVQTIFLNSTKSKSGESYFDYRGVRMIDLLKAAGMSKNATSVDVISVDGYEKNFKIDELKKIYKQGAPVFGLGEKELGSCGWVHYGSKKLIQGKPLPPANIILAFEENGEKLYPARSGASGKLEGDGPFRLITPGAKIEPPDLPEHADKSCDLKVPEANRFHSGFEHNAGNSARAVVAIRINPLPKGTQDFNWSKIGWDYIAQNKIIIYGALAKK